VVPPRGAGGRRDEVGTGSVERVNNSDALNLVPERAGKQAKPFARMLPRGSAPWRGALLSRIRSQPIQNTVPPSLSVAR
jgi:hypothetical protein